MLKHTPLYAIHQKYGARLVPFAGWEMPLQYKGIVEEHLAVRQRAGIFDVSHMGEIRIRGRGSLSFIQRLTSNDAARIEVGQAQYTAVLNETGGIIDDLIVYRQAARDFLLVPNASNAEKILRWFQAHQTGEEELRNEGENWGEVAFQGPRAQEILQKLAQSDLSSLKYFHFRPDRLKLFEVLIARTGYTGEDGFEIFCSPDDTPLIWEAIMEAGKDLPVEPCGLGARNTLRMEMKFALHGNDIDETTNPLEAGLGWIVKLDKGDFIGKGALLKVKAEGLKRKLVGFELLAPGVPREHYAVLKDDRQIGTVTSGMFSPLLKKGIGLAYVEPAFQSAGNTFFVSIRDKPVPAQVAETPFWKSGTVGKNR